MEIDKIKLKKAFVLKYECVACGSCTKVCPKGAIQIHNGIYAQVDDKLCIGCKKCVENCPASAIKINGEVENINRKTKKWYDYMWIISTTYLVLGFFNILFAWLGLICFFVPIILSIVTGSKLFCKKYCGRGQLFTLIGDKLNICLNQETPKVLRSKIFRYGFLIFFLIMFVSMITNTYLVFENYKSVEQVVTLFWTFKLNWSFAYGGSVASWIAQFAFGFYSIMLTSTIIGFIMMILFKPRTWCVFCPMGTMCHLICEARNNADDDNTSDNNEDNSIAEKVVENEQEELTEDIRE